MTIRLRMLEKASQAKRLVNDAALIKFLKSKHNPDGGFQGRSEKSDLYYTVFGLESLIALGAAPDEDKVAGYLKTFGSGEGLNLVHLACLARCWANLSHIPIREELLQRINSCKIEDKGFGEYPNEEEGSVYNCFMALCACEDLEAPLPDVGEWVKEQESTASPVEAAKVVVLKRLGCQNLSGQKLLENHNEAGGFQVSPLAPFPDLLSTATCLFALNEIQASIDHIKNPCLDYVNSLWDERGGFTSMAFDNSLDCEYAYYGLLALGLL